jgi:hypothetical protein
MTISHFEKNDSKEGSFDDNQRKSFLSYCILNALDSSIYTRQES